MAERKMKRVSDSVTSQVQILTLAHLNGYHRLFGGQLMSWMDIVAGVTARRHCDRNVTTVRVDGFEFHLPAHANDMLSFRGHVAYAGNTSMMIKVEAFVEKLNGKKELADSAWFMMVALDENERPAPVPGILPETDEERAEYEYAKKLKDQMKKSF